MRLGGMSRMPHRMGGGKPDAVTIYEALQIAKGTAYSKDDSTIQNGQLRARAHAIARAQAAQDRGGLQVHPAEATDCLPVWESIVAHVPDPSETEDHRRRVVVARVRGNGQPTESNIISVLSDMLGETVGLLTTTAPVNDESPPTPGGAPTLTRVIGGGALLVGDHKVAYAFVDSSGNVGAFSPISTIALGAGNTRDAIIVQPVTLTGSAVAVNYYLSVATGSTSLALVAQGNGTAITLSQYPIPPEIRGYHHHTIVVSAATLANAVKIRAIHEVLGPWLGSHTTYDIVSLDGPFILGTSTTAGASPLGISAL